MANRHDERKYGMGFRPTMRTRKYSQAELNYRRTVNRAVAEVDEHLSLIFTMVMYDKFDWRLRKLANCQDKIISLKTQIQQGLISNDDLERFAEIKKIDYKDKVKKIPMSQKMFLAGAHKNRNAVSLDKFINGTFEAVFLLILGVLKTDYRMSNADIGKVFDWIAYYIDSYFRKYTSDEGIVEAFKISEGINIITGEKISEEERMALY